MLMFWTAGIVELAETVPNSYPVNYVNDNVVGGRTVGSGARGGMEQADWGCRVAAGVRQKQTMFFPYFKLHFLTVITY